MSRSRKRKADSKPVEKPPELKDIEEGTELFSDMDLLTIWRNNFKGIQFETEQYFLKGAVDAMLKKGDKLTVLDFKTRGYPLKEDTADHYQNQLDNYNFLLRKNNYETEDYAYLLFYHPDKVNEKGNIVFHTDLIKLPISVSNAEKIFEDALKVLSSDIPKASENCAFCNWVSEVKDL